MITSLAAGYLHLRLLVAALGERCDPPWWRSQFFTPTGQRFLREQLFPRTAPAAAVASVGQSACNLYDPALLGAPAYHLYRLPPDLELELRDGDLYQTDACQELIKAIASGQSLTPFLTDVAGDAPSTVEAGPISCGDEQRLRTPSGLRALASTYLAGLESGKRVVPYFEAAQ